MACNKKLGAIAGSLALILWLSLTVCRGQLSGPGRMVELLPATTLQLPTMSGISGIALLAPNPQGFELPTRKRMMAALMVNSAPTVTPTGGANSLDVYLQSSPDNGQTWQDFAHVNVGTSGTGTYYVPISFVDGTSYPATVPTVMDGTMANNTIAPYVVGRRLRAKYKFSYGVVQTVSQPWSFRVVVVPD